ncbi:hypothetical protein D3C81_173720 [compost metagenome]
MTLTREEIITEEDIYAKFVHLSLDIMNPIHGAINIVNLAALSRASKYRTRKHVHALRDKGMVELKCFNIPSEDEIYPPYWGYVLTEKGKDTEYFRQEKEKDDQILKECFVL